jgi:type II secretory pathway pseudopilin PulG
MKSSKGLTLVEAIVVVTLMAIITFGIGIYITTSMQAWILISGRDAAVTTARTAMNRMVSELRCIREIQSFEASKCDFIDIDMNNIVFMQSGSNLLRTFLGSSNILATGLSLTEGLRFTYLDATGEVTAVKENIRSIRIKLYLSSGAQYTTLESSARIRNPVL